MEPSPSVEAIVRERIARLDRFHDRITSCAVTIEAPHRHGPHGKLYRAQVDVTVPGREVVIGREHEENRAHEDVYVAIRDSFEAARRLLEDIVRKSGQGVADQFPDGCAYAVPRVFQVVFDQLDPGESAKVIDQLPVPLRNLWPDVARRAS